MSPNVKNTSATPINISVKTVMYLPNPWNISDKVIVLLPVSPNIFDMLLKTGANIFFILSATFESTLTVAVNTATVVLQPTAITAPIPAIIGFNISHKFWNIPPI